MTTSNEAARSRRRYRGALLSSGALFAAKVVASASALITVPLALHYLGSERYGMWMTITSVSLLLQYADLGIGNGVVSAVARATGKDDAEAIAQIVASALGSLAVVGLGIVGILAAVYVWVPWSALFQVATATAQAEAGPALAVYIVGIALNLPLGVVQRVQSGMQEGYKATLWQCAGSLLGLVLTVCAISLQAGLPWLVAGAVGGPIAANIMAGATLARTAGGRAWRRATYSPQVAKALMGTGVFFAVQSLAWTVAYGSDNLVITQVLGPEAVADYSIPMRVFGLASTVVSMAVTPLWPALSEAHARRDFAWVKLAAKRAIVMTSVVSVLVAGGLLVSGNMLISMWLRTPVHYSYALLGGMASWCVLNTIAYALLVFHNGAGAVRECAYWAMLMSIVALLGKLWGAQAYQLTGAIWATSLAMLALLVVPLGIRLPRRWAGSSPGGEV